MDVDRKIKWETLKESIIKTMLDSEIKYLKYSEIGDILDDDETEAAIMEKIKNTSQKEWEDRARERIESKIAKSVRENTFEKLMQEVNDINLEKREKFKRDVEKIASERKVTICVECGKPGKFKYFHGFKKYDIRGKEILDWDESDFDESIDFYLCKEHADEFDKNENEDSLFREHLIDMVMMGFGKM